MNNYSFRIQITVKNAVVIDWGVNCTDQLYYSAYPFECVISSDTFFLIPKMPNIFLQSVH